MMKLSKAIIFTLAVFDQHLAKLVEARLTRRLLGFSGYDFTADYVSHVISIWEKYLSEFKGKENLRFLEIGCFEGRSSIWFLENILTHPTASITCIDSFIRRGGEPRFDHNIRISGLSSKVTKKKGESEIVLTTLQEESFDFIYIDGCHLAPNVLMDGVCSWLLLKPEGIMIFDDYAWERQRAREERPEMAIDMFLKAFQDRIELMHKGYQVVIRKKNYS